MPVEEAMKSVVNCVEFQKISGQLEGDSGALWGLSSAALVF